MVVFPNAKINLGLYITARRPDGYHDLETVFYPVPLCDILECMEAPELLFESSGLPIPGDPEHNLVLKAWHVLRRDFPHLPPVHIHLHKIIPMGAGLGGGSSDAAFMLKLLNQLFTLGLANEQLLAYALELGSDCPFFIQNQPAFASGRGEILQPLSFSVPMGTIVLVYPAVHRSTAQAFQQVTAT
ncbi:MAG TPA: 4-(cytidine 5'-diphospho)-2-C-methyl-D-erythritol kinase, partial [Chitinophagaceae bacterium]|nr:4-(cytidine 5'-diphospho)-2-C-methyl-D-erythritol kinase [Chitinophagaceae bacterium]